MNHKNHKINITMEWLKSFYQLISTESFLGNFKCLKKISAKKKKLN